MFLLLPIGVERANVRIPIVSAAVALICLVLLLVTWVFAGASSNDQIDTILSRWETHPYLRFSPAFAKKVLRADADEKLDGYEKKWLKTHPLPDPATVEEEQAEFDAAQEQFLATLDASLFDRLSLTSRAGLQVGWLTHMFLHAGWLHFLGNMLFLYLCGPLLEDVWGRRWFLLFYLVGGLAAAGALVAAARHDFHGMVGASGAIAACMGAFAVRFYTRKVSIAWFLWLFRPLWGVWHWPAWVCGLLWFGDQAVSFATGSDPGTAVMAHLGGFVFGASIAFGMKAIGLERATAATSDSDLGPLRRSYLKEVEDARGMLASGDRAGARRALLKALQAAPDDEDATWMLVRLDLEEGFQPRGVGRLERLLRQKLKAGETEDAVGGLWDLWAQLDPSALSPGMAAQLLPVVKAWNRDSPMLAALQARTGKPAADGEQSASRLPPAAGRFSAIEPPPRPAANRFAPIELADEPAPPEAGEEGEAVAAAPAPAPAAPPRVLAAVVEGAGAEGITIRSPAGQPRLLRFNQILGVTAGMVPSAADPARARLLVDLVVQRQPLVCVRIDSETGQVQRHFPGAGGRAVYVAFLSALLEGSGAKSAPIAEALAKGEFPRYASEAEFGAVAGTLG